MARRRRPEKAIPTTREVLRGHIEVRIEDLFRLIGEVNPTDRNLDRVEQSRRYDLKAQLQCLLIERFADELLVEGDPKNEQIVSLVHRHGRHETCHAKPSELDVEARAWVQFQLDLGKGTARVPETGKTRPPRRGAHHSQEAPEDNPAPPSFPRDLLKKAQRMMEEYDYEEASRALQSALRAAKSDLDVATERRAALMLLELQVDLLAANEDALPLADVLSPEVSSDQTVRGFLALAAARAGNSGLARKFLKGIESERGIAVHFELARAELRSQDVEQAEREIRSMREIDPGHPDVLALEREIRAARAEQAKPLQGVLGELIEQGAWREAAGKARELLALDQSNEFARNILRKLARREHEDELRRLTEVAKAELGSGRLELAAAALERLRAADHAQPELEAQLSDERAIKTERATAEKAEQVCTQLRGEELIAGLLAWLELEETAQSWVRAELNLPHFQWLDQVRGGSGSFRRSQAVEAVEAVVALGEARELLGARNFAAADKLTSSHEKTLRKISAGTVLLGELRRALTEQHRQDQLQALAAIEAALDHGDVKEAREILDSLSPRHLGKEERDVHDDLAERIVRAEDALALERRYRYLLETGDLVEARRISSQGQEVAGERESSIWSARIRDLGHQIRERWCFRILEGSAVPEPSHPRRPSRFAGESCLTLLPDDSGIAMAISRERWVTIRLWGIGGSRPNRLVTLRTPEPMGSLHAYAMGESLWLFGSRGKLLELETDRWNVLTWRCVRKFLKEGEFVEGGFLPGGLRYLWLQLEDRRSGRRNLVIDLPHWNVLRDVKLDSAVHPISGSENPHVAAMDTFGGVRLLDARGSIASFPEIQLTKVCLDASIHPSGMGHVFLVTEDLDGIETVPLEVLEVRPDGSAGHSYLIEEGDPQRTCQLETSLETGRVHIHFVDCENRPFLRTLRLGERGLELVDECAISESAILVRHGHGRQVSLLVAEEGTPHLLSLLEDRPDLPEKDQESPWGLDPISYPWQCRIWGDDEEFREMGDELLDLPIERHRKWAEEKCDLWAKQPARLLQLWRTLRVQQDQSLRDAVEERLVSEHPTSPSSQLIQAERRGRDDDWSEVQRLLESADRSLLSAADAQHACHLLGLSLLRTSRVDKAREAFREGKAIEVESCDLTSCLLLADLLSGEPAPEACRAEDALLARFVEVILESDTTLENRSFEDAVALLEQRSIWSITETQSSARRAMAYLELDRNGDAFWYCKMRALSHLLTLEYSQSLPLGSSTWSPHRVQELRRRSQGWLDSQRAQPLSQLDGATGGALPATE